MRFLVSKMICLGMLLLTQVWCGFAQTGQTTEQQLEDVTADLKKKTLEYNWKLAETYADYCIANTKYISWNNLPYLKQIVEFDHPEELEPYRLKSEECKRKLDEFLNSHPEYVKLMEQKKQAVTEDDQKINKAAFSAFYQELRNTERATYAPLYSANQKAVCRYRAEALKYMVNYYRQHNRLMPVSFIAYRDLSELQYKGSELELMKSEIQILEDLQKDLLKQVSREKYGLEK